VLMRLPDWGLNWSTGSAFGSVHGELSGVYGSALGLVAGAGASTGLYSGSDAGAGAASTETLSKMPTSPKVCSMFLAQSIESREKNFSNFMINHHNLRLG
jgi:hypothetical protein